MKKQTLFLAFIVAIASGTIFSCKKHKLDNMVGQVQKGPFAKGTSVTVTELESGLKPTGKTYSATINNDKGTFSIPDVTLKSPYVNLTADGYYFNEITGKISDGRLVLHAIADVSNASTVNVNILTHLEKARVEYLIDVEEMTFTKAKQQAQQEVLAIFNMSNSSVPNSEELDIAQSGDGNAKLMAISVIVQGSLTTGELSEFLANIADDIKEDGTLDNAASQSTLINHAKYLWLKEIRQNTESRFINLGISAVLPDFEQHVQHFVKHTNYALTKIIHYPLVDNSSILNVMHPSHLLFEAFNRNFSPSARYRFSGTLPAGVKAKYVFKNTSANLNNQLQIWSNSPDIDVSLNFDTGIHVVNFKTAGITFNETIKFTGNGSATIEYFEHGDSAPSMVKNISWE
ncbi:MAG: hypothetical protein H0X62_07415 [Bacteroidetes bacterium]|nr:hypothetical protein [Bacteroidota bacterium]